MSDGSSLAGRLARVRERMADACARAGRDPAGVTLVAVSKFHPAAAVREAGLAGQSAIGIRPDKERMLSDGINLILHGILVDNQPD